MLTPANQSHKKSGKNFERSVRRLTLYCVSLLECQQLNVYLQFVPQYADAPSCGLLRLPSFDDTPGISTDGDVQLSKSAYAFT